MTHKRHKYQLSKQLKSYIDFLPFCSNEKEVFKLLDEIHFIKLKIERVDQMKLSQVHEQVKMTTLIVTSF